MRLKIRGARVVDPKSGFDEISSLYCVDGRIAAIGEWPGVDNFEELDCSGMVAVPGLMDIHVHFREPGYEYKENILGGAQAAAQGGFTTVVCMPNTNPAVDNKYAVEDILWLASDAAIEVLPIAAVTIGRKGEKAVDFNACEAAGAVAFSDDGDPIGSEKILREALILTSLPIIDHCEAASLVEGGHINEGAVSRRLNIKGRPAEAENLMVSRNIELARRVGGHIHIAHVSTATAVELIRRAKADGVHVTCEACPHHFTLTEEAVITLGPMAKINPPLRIDRDRMAIIRGIADGTIDAIVTDHAPHTMEEKALPLYQAPAGVIGLQTALGLSLTILGDEGVPLVRIIDALTRAPAEILGLERGSLTPGARADITLFAPDELWTVDPKLFRGKARNTPFAGMELRGRVKYTISKGEIVYTDKERRRHAKWR